MIADLDAASVEEAANMETTGAVTAFPECDVSVKGLDESMMMTGDLHALTTRIVLDVDGSGSVARQKLREQVVTSIEAYSDQLAELTDALTAMIDIDPAFQAKKVFILNVVSDIQESRDLVLCLPPPATTGAKHD